MIKTCPKCGRPTGASGGCECTRLLASGAVVSGRYEIVRVLGRGAAATVYHAHDRILDEPVALKVLDRPDAGPDAAARLRSEIKLARRVTHPNVCRIHEYGEDGEHRFICMELIDGRNLRDVLAERGRLPAPEACGLAAQAAFALQAIHATGIVHRDVKTANLIQDAAGRVFVTDFGVATRGGTQSIWGGGYVAGTPEYMSPEQARAVRLDARSDLYGLGIVLFELSTGRLPFLGATEAETLVKQVSAPVPLEVLEIAGVPSRVQALIARLLAKQPDERPASAGEVAEALRALAFEEPLPLVPTSPKATTVVSKTLTLQPAGRRARRAAAQAAAALALLALVAVVGRWLEHRSPGDAVPALSSPPATGSLARSPAPKTARPRPPVRWRTARAGTVADTAPAIQSREPHALPPHEEETPTPPELAPEPPPLEPPLEPQPEPAAAPTSDMGHLQLGILPWAEVTLDDVPVGTTPLRPVPLTPGTYTARLTHPDFRPVVRKVTIRPGETTPLRIDLRLDGIRNR